MHCERSWIFRSQLVLSGMLSTAFSSTLRTLIIAHRIQYIDGHATASEDFGATM